MPFVFIGWKYSSSKMPNKLEIFLVEDAQQVAGGDGELSCFSSQDLRMFEVVCAAPQLQRYVASYEVRS
jgi:hypothetical protein